MRDRRDGGVFGEDIVAVPMRAVVTVVLVFGNAEASGRSSQRARSKIIYPFPSLQETDYSGKKYDCSRNPLLPSTKIFPINVPNRRFQTSLCQVPVNCEM